MNEAAILGHALDRHGKMGAGAASGMAGSGSCQHLNQLRTRFSGLRQAQSLSAGLEGPVGAGAKAGMSRDSRLLPQQPGWGQLDTKLAFGNAWSWELLLIGLIFLFICAVWREPMCRVSMLSRLFERPLVLGS